MSTFTYRETKAGEVHIDWQGRTVTTLRGARAASFLARADGADEEARQELLRRATGNFKRGNER